MRHTTSTHALIALTAAAIAVSGVYASAFRLSTVADLTLARAEALPMQTHPTPHVLGETQEVASSETEGLAPASERLYPPMERALERVTKKPFGIEIHPATSPVPNDRFDGFHVGVDFETFADEQDIDLPVYAVCDGALQFKARAKGYGGVAVQSCRLDGRNVSVIYGHLRLESIGPAAGERLTHGQRIGLLGRGYSEETDGVRKHLHLGLRLREDDSTDIRGYVRSATETELYVDAMRHIR